MWEEKCESIRVSRHQLSDADSDEEFVLVETGKFTSLAACTIIDT